MKNWLIGFIMVCLVQVSVAQTLLNPSFENWANPTVCETNTAPDQWLDFSNGGLAPDEGNYPLCPSTIPGSASHGNVYARFMAGTPLQGEGMHQPVSGFSPGKQYLLTFDFAGSNLWGGNDNLRFHIFLNGVRVDSTIIFSSADTLWQKHVLIFNAPTSTVDIAFRAHTPAWPTSGGSAAMDNVGLQPYTLMGAGVDVKSIDFAVYPNPCTSFLQLKFPTAESLTFRITDINGRPVLEGDLPESATINTAGLVPGCYLLQVFDAGQLTGQNVFLKSE